MPEGFMAGIGYTVLALFALIGAAMWIGRRLGAASECYPAPFDSATGSVPRGINGERFRRPRKYVGAYGVITTSYSRN